MTTTHYFPSEEAGLAAINAATKGDFSLLHAGERISTNPLAHILNKYRIEYTCTLDAVDHYYFTLYYGKYRNIAFGSFHGVSTK